MSFTATVMALAAALSPITTDNTDTTDQCILDIMGDDVTIINRSDGTIEYGLKDQADEVSVEVQFTHAPNNKLSYSYSVAIDQLGVKATMQPSGEVSVSFGKASAKGDDAMEGRILTSSLAMTGVLNIQEQLEGCLAKPTSPNL